MVSSSFDNCLAVCSQRLCYCCWWYLVYNSITTAPWNSNRKQNLETGQLAMKERQGINLDNASIGDSDRRPVSLSRHCLLFAFSSSPFRRGLSLLFFVLPPPPPSAPLSIFSVFVLFPFFIPLLQRLTSVASIYGTLRYALNSQDRSNSSHVFGPHYCYTASSWPLTRRVTFVAVLQKLLTTS